MFERILNRKKQPKPTLKCKNKTQPDEKGAFVITGLKQGGSSWSLGNSHINKFSFADALSRCGIWS